MGTGYRGSTRGAAGGDAASTSSSGLCSETPRSPGSRGSPPCEKASRFFFFQAEDGIRDGTVTGVQMCALPISSSVMFDWLPLVSVVPFVLPALSPRQTLWAPVVMFAPAEVPSAVMMPLACLPASQPTPVLRSEERRVGKECGSQWYQYHYNGIR